MTQESIESFLKKLETEEKGKNVIAEYARNLSALKQVAEEEGDILSREVLLEWQQGQTAKGLAAGTVTNQVVRINQYLRYLNCEELCFPKGSRQNLAGQRFGDLVVVEASTRRTPDRSVYWICRCEKCGKQKEIPANQLLKGSQVSCGCGRIRRLQESNGYLEGTSLKNIFSNKISSNNTSGHKGVYQKNGKWAAKIQYKKKTYYLGSYDSLEEAVNARRQAENRVRDDAEKLLDKLEETNGGSFRKGML